MSIDVIFIPDAVASQWQNDSGLSLSELGFTHINDSPKGPGWCYEGSSLPNEIDGIPVFNFIFILSTQTVEWK